MKKSQLEDIDLFVCAYVCDWSQSLPLGCIFKPELQSKQAGRNQSCTWCTSALVSAHHSAPTNREQGQCLSCPDAQCTTITDT